jgi:hypothetical protein
MLLATKLANESESYSIRRAAYMSLLKVSGRPAYSPQDLNLRIPEDIDWEFVHGALAQRPPAWRPDP